MAKDVTPGCPGVGGKRKGSVGDGEVGGVLVETHVSARHPGRRLVGGKKLKRAEKRKAHPWLSWSKFYIESSWINCGAPTPLTRGTTGAYATFKVLLCEERNLKEKFIWLKF